MKTVKLNFFWFLALFLSAETFLATFLAIWGHFNNFFLLLTFFLLGLLFLWLFRRKTFQLSSFSKLSGGVLLFLFLYGTVLSYFSFPTFFGGRDEGSYANSAILLNNNQKLEESSSLIKELEKIYGPGKALNFPGFYYEKNGHLKSQFLPAYPVWLAIFYHWGGINGLKIANLFPFILLIFSVFSLFRLLFLEKIDQLSIKQKKFFSLLPVALLATSLPLIIFYKFTLSEIWFASLLWLSLYLSAIYFSKQRNRAVYYSALLPLLLLPLSRIEGPVIIFMFLLFFILEDSVNLKKVEYQTPFVLLLGIFFFTLIWEPSFFINAFKGLAEPFFPGANQLVSTTKEKGLWPDDWNNFYTFKLFFTYNLWPLWLMLIGSLISLWKNFAKNWRAKNHLEFSLPLLPFIVLLPIFFYFWDANISLDHPWMLRRFIFALLPLAILYSSYFLITIYFKSAKLTYAITLTLLVINLTLFQSHYETLDTSSLSTETQDITIEKQPLNFLSFVSQKDLWPQIKELDKKIDLQSNDLVLISQKASGSGWSMPAEPWRNLLKRNAVYFFNPNDLEKIDRQKFNRIFLITSENEESLYQKIAKEKFLPYVWENSFIFPSRDPLAAPQGLKLKTKGMIYLIK